MALQRWGDADLPAMLDEAAAWATGSRLEQRAAAAGTCEPRLLRDPAVVRRVLALLDAITASCRAHRTGAPTRTGRCARRWATAGAWRSPPTRSTACRPSPAGAAARTPTSAGWSGRTSRRRASRRSSPARGGPGPPSARALHGRLERLHELAAVQVVVEAAARRAARRACPARRSRPWSITRIVSASRIVESRWAMTKRRPALHQPGHRPLDEHLGARVDRARRLVEDEDRRVGQEGPGDRQQLLLARRHVRRVVVDDGVVAVGQRAHEVVDVGRLGRGEDLAPRSRPRGRRRCSRGSCRGTARCPGGPSRTVRRRSSRVMLAGVDAVDRDPARRRSRRSASAG